MILLKMQGVPAPHPDLALLPGPGEVLVRHHFGLGRPGMQNRPVRGRPPALARRAGRRGAAQLTVNAQSARQRVPGRGGGKLLLGRNPRIDREEPGDRAGRQVREHRATASSQLAPKRTRWTHRRQDKAGCPSILHRYAARGTSSKLLVS